MFGLIKKMFIQLLTIQLIDLIIKSAFVKQSEMSDLT